MKISFFIELLRKVSIFKTIVFNVHYFPLKVAVRFPAIIYRRTKLANMGGGTFDTITAYNGYAKNWTSWSGNKR